MHLPKCNFSATAMGNRFIYTIYKQDIERYDIAKDSWELLPKLKHRCKSCACFCPQPNKIVILGGNLGQIVREIDIETGESEALNPMIHDRKRLANKLCLIDNYAYAVGGDSLTG